MANRKGERWIKYLVCAANGPKSRPIKKFILTDEKIKKDLPMGRYLQLEARIARGRLLFLIFVFRYVRQDKKLLLYTFVYH
jgi:hypothetical protein